MRAAPRFREQKALRGPGFDAVRQLDRSARTPALVHLPPDAAQALRGLDLVVVGLGSVGLHTCDLAARVGVRGLRLVDGAQIVETSLLTHPCSPGDIGRPKVRVAAERAKAVHPAARVYAFEGPFEALPTHLLAGASCVLLASDNLACEVRVAQAALHLGLPVIQSAVYGSTLTAQIRSFASSGSGADGCLACSYGRSEWEALDRSTRFSCAGAPEGVSPAPERARVPTTSPPFLCALAANLGFVELARRVLGLGDPGSRIVDYNGFTHHTTVSPLVRRADCPLEHARDRIVVRAGSRRGLAAATPRELLDQAGYTHADLRRTTLALEGYAYTTHAACACPDHPRVGRFLRPDASAGTCRRCRGERAPHPLHTYAEVPTAALGDRLQRSLAALGAASPTSVRVRGAQGSVRFLREFPERGGSA